MFWVCFKNMPTCIQELLVAVPSKVIFFLLWNSLFVILSQLSREYCQRET